jgi:hypothetical protein
MMEPKKFVATETNLQLGLGLRQALLVFSNFTLGSFELGSLSAKQ